MSHYKIDDIVVIVTNLDGKGYNKYIGQTAKIIEMHIFGYNLLMNDEEVLTWRYEELKKHYNAREIMLDIESVL